MLSSLRRASCQFHALFRELTLTLFAMPDIIPATDETEWKISSSSSDLGNILCEMDSEMVKQGVQL